MHVTEYINSALHKVAVSWKLRFWPNWSIRRTLSATYHKAALLYSQNGQNSIQKPQISWIALYGHIFILIGQFCRFTLLPSDFWPA